MSCLAALLRPRVARLSLPVLLVLLLGACASLGGGEPLNLHVVGIEPLPGEGLEMRFAVKLRVQNPNTSALAYDGIAIELRVNGRPLASGVSDQRGNVPRFGEVLIEVPVSISAFSAMRQALGLAEYTRLDRVPYTLSGRLSGAGLFGGRRFSSAGVIDLSGVGIGRR
jgi:hypothetical protein